MSHVKEFSLLIEERHWIKGCKYIAGIDEVGRGALAGPVFACAVIFEPYVYDARIKDSKRLTARARKEMSDQIHNLSRDWSIGIASVEEIDRFNIRQATFMAMKRALYQLRLAPDLVLIDGNAIPGSKYEEIAVIDGDEKSFTIAAASILAKVKRDEFMSVLSANFPEYRFEKNKGYGTSDHILSIKKSGPTIQHRYSFLKKILNSADNWKSVE